MRKLLYIAIPLILCSFWAGGVFFGGTEIPGNNSPQFGFNVVKLKDLQIYRSGAFHAIRDVDSLSLSFAPVNITYQAPGDANATAVTNSFVDYFNITAARTLTLPTPTAGAILIVKNYNGNGFAVNRSGSPIIDINNFSISSFPDKTVTTMRGDGTIWKIVSGGSYVATLPSGTGGDVAASAGFVQQELSGNAPQVLTGNVTLTLNTQYSLNSASQLQLTLPATAGFASDGKKTINITASNTGGGKILIPNGYTVRGIAGTAHTDGTGYITITQFQQLLIKPDVAANSYIYQVLSGSVTVY